MSRTSGAGAGSVGDITSATFWSKKSAKASAERPLAGREAPSPFLPSPSLIARQREAGSRRVSILAPEDSDGYRQFWISNSVPAGIGRVDASTLTPPPSAHEPPSNGCFCSGAQAV